MELNAGAFLAFWDVQPIQQHETTNKLFYRIIAGRKYQFRKLDYRKQTQLGLRVAAMAKRLEPLFRQWSSFIDVEEDATDPQREAADRHNQALMMELLPEMLGFIGDPEVEQLLHDLVVAAAVDLGQGTFEQLTNAATAETVFGEDISIQIPVAITVLEVNLAGFIKRVASGFFSKT